MRMSFRILLTLALFGILGGQSLAEDYDVCREPLKESLRGIIERRSDLTESQQTKAWFCSEKFNQEANRRGGNLDLTIPLKDKIFALKGGFTSDDSKLARDAFCSDQSAELSRNTMDYLYVSFTDPKAFDSFNKCVETIAKANPADLLQLITRDEGSVVFFNVRFTPPANVTLPDPEVQQVAVNGAKCEGSLAKGSKINREGQSLICYRDVKDEVSFAVFTDRGARFDKVRRDRTPEKAGYCNVLAVKSEESWIENGSFSTAAWTSDLHCSGGCDDWYTRSGVNWAMSVQANADERIGEFIALHCEKARPDVDGNPCEFTSVVSGPSNDGRIASITVRSWSGPVLLSPRWKKLSRKVSQKPTIILSRELNYGETFEISADRGDAETYLECKLDGSSRSYHPRSDKGDETLELVGEKPMDRSINYIYRVTK